MIHCAEKLLKTTRAAIGEYASGHRDDVSLWRDIGSLRGLSLQELSLKSDAEFFREINSVLNVITTILVHPHIVNERGTIILRAEQAHGLTPEMFLDTVHDQRLWKDKRGVMTPAEVYYFQNIDRLTNYENRFVVHLIDQIGGQLNDYAKFYDYLLATLSRDDALTLDGSELETLLGRLESLSKKVRRIKGTYFYREVSKAAALTHVEATNVLKHNRLYNYCYRFYVRYVTYGDEQARADDLCTYFFTRLLIALKTLGFELSSAGKKAEDIVRPMAFASPEFDVEVEGAPRYGGLKVTVTAKQSGGLHSQNLLLFDGAADFGTVRRNLAEYPKGMTSTDAVSLWDLAYVESDVAPQNTAKTDETGLLVRYLKDKTRTDPASRAIYETRCPVCGGKDVDVQEAYHVCGRCGSVWCFVGDRAWFARLRKR